MSAMTMGKPAMSNHTPGLWSAEPVWNIPKTMVHAYCQGRAYALAEVYSMPGPGEREANAKLIAAAPELLQALIDLSDWLAYGLNKADGAEPTAEDHAACERVAAQARAAIAKATANS
jgi:hypothetical protein